MTISKINFHNNLELTLISSNRFLELNPVHIKRSNFHLAFGSKMLQEILSF